MHHPLDRPIAFSSSSLRPRKLIQDPCPPLFRPRPYFAPYPVLSQPWCPGLSSTCDRAHFRNGTRRQSTSSPDLPNRHDPIFSPIFDSGASICSFLALLFAEMPSVTLMSRANIIHEMFWAGGGQREANQYQRSRKSIFPTETGQILFLSYSLKPPGRKMRLDPCYYCLNKPILKGYFSRLSDDFFAIETYRPPMTVYFFLFSYA